ncbi:Uncharacterised protein [BD1-7 clade bacterium]|uniref:HEAT repeat domain-containing protein n=1 Tax=BD1-7 clade bacterium TaxID=2029982 RepID=A0A5S9QH12_9GAMM|nr:Uncharacterised protein [BD1-7 clade bacterium]
MDIEKSIADAAREFAISLSAKTGVVADIRPLVHATNGMRLSNLDMIERHLRWEFERNLVVPTTSRWQFRKPKERILTWVDICSGSGRTREKALRTISGSAPNSFFFAMVFRRLNDWVPEVRKAATEIIPRMVRETDPDIVSEVLCAILPHWRSWGRAKDSEFEILDDVLKVKEISSALKSKMLEATTGPMSQIFAQVARSGVFDQDLQDFSNDATQPALRALSYRCQLSGKLTWFTGRKWVCTDKVYNEGRYVAVTEERELISNYNFIDVIQLAVLDRSSIVRRVAAEYLIREYRSIGEIGLTLAKLLAKDSSSSVAESGSFVLKKLTEQVSS